MTLYAISQAYQAIDAFLSLLLPFPKTRAILKMKESMRPESEFYQLEYNKLLRQYAAVDENGMIKTENELVLFPSDDIAAECLRKVTELRTMESEMEPKEPVFLTPEDVGSQRISGKSCELLRGIIEIGGE